MTCYEHHVPGRLRIMAYAVRNDETGSEEVRSAGVTGGAMIAEPVPIAKPDTIPPFSHPTFHLL